MSELGVESRFWIQRELGRGSKSIVLDVWDALHDVRRALKIAGTRSGRRALEAEYRLLTELRHPHVARAYDFGISRTGLPYYTLELVDGVSFDVFARRQPPEVIAVVAMQVLEALSTLHLRGIVHRDLKPRNVLVAGEGAAAVARLIDFGLATRGAAAGTTGGTLPYMAPEVARGEVVDGRADLYGLGVMLYEALVPDATHDDLARVARRHVALPVSPGQVNPLVPRDFADFVMCLMQPEAGRRYGSAFEAATALSRCETLGLTTRDEQTTIERMLRGGAVSHRPRDIGRLVALAREVKRKRAPHAVVLLGREGMGKTPLLRELGATLCVEGFRVAHFRTSRAPDAPLDRILRAAHALRPDVVAEVTPDWTRRRDALTSLADRDPSTFVTRLSSLLVDAFADEPTALLMDDIQRAEPIALQVVEAMARDRVGTSLLIVCASDEAVSPLGDEATVMRLSQLDEEEVAALVAHRVQGLRLPQPALVRLLADGRGEPTLIERTLARFFIDGLVTRRQGKMLFTGGRYRGRPDARATWRPRAEALREPIANVAYAAAVLGERIDAASVAALTGCDLAEAQSALAELSQRGFLAAARATQSPSYIFTRRFLRDMLYDVAPADLLRRLHDRAATFLGGSASEPTPELIEHLLRGSDNKRAITIAIEAGDRAARVFSDKRAVEYYTHAYQRLEGARDPRGATIAARIGRSLTRTGDIQRAITWYRAALIETRGRDLVTSIEASLGLAQALLASGEPEEASRHASLALALVDDEMPTLTAAALRIQASVAISAGDHDVAGDRLARAHGILERRLGASDASDTDAHAPLALSVEVMLEQARLARRMGQLAASVRYAKRALQRARAIGDPSSVAKASAVLARGFARAGRMNAARRALFAGLKGVRASGDRLREAGMLREIGHLRLRQGHFDAAIERYTSSLELVRSLRARAHESACLADIGFVRTMLGDFRAAQMSLTLAIDTAEASGDVRAGMVALASLGLTLAWMGDLTGASSALENVLASPVAKTDAVLMALAGAVKAGLDARLGVTDAAGAFLDGVAPMLKALEDPADESVLLLLCGQCAIALGRHGDAFALHAALRSAVTMGALAFIEAPMELLAADVLRAHGDDDRAREALERALAKAEEQGARFLAIQAHLQLGRAHKGTTTGAEHLTRAMELLQVASGELPDDMLSVLLASPLATRLRRAFSAERFRLLGSR